MVNKLEEVVIEGINQSILVRGENIENPLILMLHGGPGAPLMPFSHTLKRLEDEFIVAYWDQRGAGKSYSDGIPSNTMTLEIFLKDAIEVIQFLKSEYDKNRIFLAGHSWGSLLGINIAYQYPSNIYAYVGISQVTNYIKGLKVSYDFALKEAEEKNMIDKIEKLKEIGQPPYENMSDLFLLSSYISEFGGAYHLPVDADSIIRSSEVYSPSDIECINKGMQFSAINLIEEILRTDLIQEEKTEFEIPIVFLCGKYDYFVPLEVTTEYYETIKSPNKEIMFFSKSAHFCYLEETENFIDTLIQVKQKYYT